MKIATRDVVYFHHSPLNQPAITVQPGEVFQVETELCSGGWLKSLDDRYSKKKAVSFLSEKATQKNTMIIWIIRRKLKDEDL